MIHLRSYNRGEAGSGAHSPPYRRGRQHVEPRLSLENQAIPEEKALTTVDLMLESRKKQLSELDFPDDSVQGIDESNDPRDVFKSEVERFVEISKYFSSPLRRTASYMCERKLVNYPNPYRIEYKRGGVTTQHIKFSNLTLEPVYIKLYKILPDMEQLKFINLCLSRCKRIPPGLSFNLGFVYDDMNDKSTPNAKIIFVATKKVTTPCYQVCEIDLVIVARSEK